MRRLIEFWIAHRVELGALVGQHVLLVVASTLAAAAIGVPLGIFASRRPRLASPLMAAASVVQTVPSLAMFGFLLPVPLVGGVGARAALVVLILYAIIVVIDGLLLQPYIMKRTVKVPIWASITFPLVMGFFFMRAPGKRDRRFYATAPR